MDVTAPDLNNQEIDLKGTSGEFHHVNMMRRDRGCHIFEVS